MFYAISKKYNNIICANDVTNLNDTFLCPNPQCNAEYYIKGINSERTVHFCHKHNKPHIKGCPYDMGLTKYLDDDNVVKSSIQDIYFHIRKNAKNVSAAYHNHSVQGTFRKTYINTTKDLLYFCISNPLNTIYENETTINDIIVDKRNICDNANFKGFCGLHLVVGDTIKYDLSQKYIRLRTSTITKNRKAIHFDSIVHMENSQIYEIIRYILDTFNNTFSGHTIAVLGDWTNPEKYLVECVVKEPTNIVYKFANDF